MAAKEYNVQILVDENEGAESIFQRLRREPREVSDLQPLCLCTCGEAAYGFGGPSSKAEARTEQPAAALVAAELKGR